MFASSIEIGFATDKAGVRRVRDDVRVDRDRVRVLTDDAIFSLRRQQRTIYPHLTQGFLQVFFLGERILVYRYVRVGINAGMNEWLSKT